jgi:hypothetical protein
MTPGMEGMEVIGPVTSTRAVQGADVVPPPALLPSPSPCPSLDQVRE